MKALDWILLAVIFVIVVMFGYANAENVRRHNDLTHPEVAKFFDAVRVDLAQRRRARMTSHAQRLVTDVRSLINELMNVNSQQAINEATHDIAATALMIQHERRRNAEPLKDRP